MIIGELFTKIAVNVTGLDNLDKLKDRMETVNVLSQDMAKSFGKLANNVGKAFDIPNDKLTKALGVSTENADKVAEANKSIKSSIANVDKAVEKNNRTLGGFISRLNAARVGIIGVMYALTRMTGSVVNNGLQLDTMSKSLGVSAQSLTKWQIAAKRVGADVESVFNSIKKTQNDLANGRASNVSMWNFLGIDVGGQKPEEVMRQLVDKLKNTKDDARSALLQRLGLDGNNINLGNIDLNMGRVGGLIKSDEEIKKIRELQKVFVDFTMSVKLLMERFIAFATPLKYFFELITRLTTGIDSIIKKTMGWNVVATTLGGIIIFILGKLNPLALKLTTLGLIIDDVITYFEGGESVLGDFIKWLEKADPLVKFLTVSLGALFATYHINRWTNVILSSFGLIEKQFSILNLKIMGTPLGILLFGTGLAYAGGKKLGQMLGEYGERHSGEGGFTDWAGDKLLNAKNKLTGWDRNLLPQSATNHSRTNNNNINNNITINSNQPPRDIAKQVGVITQDVLNMAGAGL
jgi:hypothetical protein